MGKHRTYMVDDIDYCIFCQCDISYNDDIICEKPECKLALGEDLEKLDPLSEGVLESG